MGLIWKVVLPFALLLGAFTMMGRRVNELGGLIDRVGGDLAQAQLDTVAKQVENEVASGGVKITTQSAFVAFVRGAMAGSGKSGDASLDHWGRPLALHIVDADRFVVVSCGGDRQCQTRDDLVAWGSFSREGAKGGDHVPGWPRERVVEMREAAAGDAPVGSLQDQARSAASWLRARPWIAIGLVVLWLACFVRDRWSARERPPRVDQERGPMAVSGPRRARRAALPPLEVAGLPPLPDREDPVALSQAPQLAAFSPPSEALAPPPPLAQRPSLAPLEPLDLAPPPPSAFGSLGPIDPLGPLVDLPCAVPIAVASPDLPAPVPPSVPEAPPAGSGVYSITRGAAVVEGEAPSSMREDLRVPAGRARSARAPKRPRKAGGAPAVIERIRPGGIASETQRIRAHPARKDDDKGEG